MSKIKFSDLPAFPKVKGQEVKPLTLNDVKNTGLSNTGGGINEGDVIEFENSVEEMTFIQRPIRPNSDRMMYMVGVLKNNKPAWLSLGVLTRRFNTESGAMPTCEFTKEMLTFNNNEERLKHLAGKKIKGTSRVDLTYYKFTEAGVRTEELETRPTILIDYVE